MQRSRILLVEDDELASEVIYNYLVDCDFLVTPVFTATDSIAHIKNENYDILILDINLPDFNGFEVLKNIKNKISLPIIITSAYSDTKSKLLAFKYGASDYMVKPLDLEELEARIWIQLGKNSEIKTQEEKKLFEIKGSNIYFEQNILDLTAIEFEILSMLIKNRSFVTKREDLVSSLSLLSSQRSLDNHIKNIRKKIGDNGNKAIYLKTIYGVGYSLQR
jgi:DNA-binding response OmpR family regulator